MLVSQRTEGIARLATGSAPPTSLRLLLKHRISVSSLRFKANQIFSLKSQTCHAQIGDRPLKPSLTPAPDTPLLGLFP